MPSIIPLPAFSDNYVWAIREGDRVAVVDPGDDEPVVRYLEHEHVALTAILVTHKHPDHVGGILDLVRDRPAPVIGPAREAVPGRTRPVVGGDRLEVPGLGLPLETIDVPGHTAGHVAYFSADAAWGAPVLFCGDTLFAAGCGRLFEGTADEMWTSLSALAGLPGDTRVYCAHEYTLSNLRFAGAVEAANPALAERTARERAKRDRGLPTLPSTIREELATNPFLRVREGQVRAAAEAHAGRRLIGDAEVFGALRDWKNAF